MGTPTEPRPDLRPRILLVDDDSDSREMIAYMLVQEGYEVVEAGSIRAALAAATSNKIDVLISDLHLPDGDGHQLPMQLGVQGYIPSIALSGTAICLKSSIESQTNFAHYLLKPASFEQLLLTIRRLLPAS